MAEALALRAQLMSSSTEDRSSQGLQFSLLLKACGAVGDYSGAERCHRGLRLVGMAASAETYARLAEAALRTGGWGAAARWVQVLGRCPEAAMVTDARGYLEVAERRYQARALEGTLGSASIVRWNAILGAAASCGDLEAVERWLQRAGSEGDGTWEAADGAVAACPGSFRPDGVVLGALVVAACRKGELRRAEEWLGRLAAAGAEPNCFAYGALVSAAGRRHGLREAEAWMERGRHSSIVPDIVMYGAVIDAAARAGNLQAGRRWLARAQEAKIKPNMVVYGSLMHAAAKRGQLTAAEQLFQEVRGLQLQPDIIAFGTLVNAAAKRRDVAAAGHWFCQACSAGIVPDDYILTSVLRAAARSGDAAVIAEWARRGGICGIGRCASTQGA